MTNNTCISCQSYEGAIRIFCLPWFCLALLDKKEHLVPIPNCSLFEVLFIGLTHSENWGKVCLLQQELETDLMSCQALKTGLELTIRTPVFSYDEEQLKCINEPLTPDIRTTLPCPLGFAVSQTSYPTGNLKEQQVSMIGHDHVSCQGVYVVDSSFDSAADKQRSILEHDCMTHLKKCMADDALHDGKRCYRPRCNEVEGQMVYCKIHGGARSCEQLGFLQSAQESSDLCISHGRQPCNEPGSSIVTSTKSEVCIKYEGDGGCKVMRGAGNALGNAELYVFRQEDAMCKFADCNQQVQVNAMYCKVHSGGVKGCMMQGCTKGAHGGTPLCIGHGGGKRCTVPGCPNAACGSSQGRTDRCVRHGGGKRCKFEGCGKGAQGNTDFCIAHGGGRRCKFEGCGKSAQGRTDFCIRHGGGRRCKFQGCNTSAKWGTDFCSVHRRSLSSGSDVTHEMLPVTPEKSRAKKPKNMVKSPGHPQGTVTTAALAGSSMHEMSIHHVATAVSNHDMSLESVTRRQAAIAHKVAVPLSIKSSQPSATTVPAEREAAAAAARSQALLGL